MTAVPAAGSNAVLRSIRQAECRLHLNRNACRPRGFADTKTEALRRDHIYRSLGTRYPLSAQESTQIVRGGEARNNRSQMRAARDPVQVLPMYASLRILRYPGD
jgi:hypothetical protein